MKRSGYRSRSRQQGAVLVVVLIMLLVMTLLGLASLRGTLMEERMTSAITDRGLSFQAAEYALREGESKLGAPSAYKSFPASGCTTGLCATPVPSTTTKDRWADSSFNGWVSVANTALFTGAAIPTAAPEYFIEYMGRAPAWPFCDRAARRAPQCMKPRFRITARSTQAGRSTVYAQTTYTTP